MRAGLARFAATDYAGANGAANLAAGDRSAWLTNTFVNKQFKSVEDLTWVCAFVCLCCE